ncbi:MAG TPA: single-stranded-DNA-specific exonuclease RecJ [Candidatus Limnocylindrales bacterium]|nr:single-stranded-DNA-specific exonuclease RecJ [Candidatus Limnocylindrales bacterium]
MLAPRSRWLFPTAVSVSQALLDAGRDVGLGARAVGLLAARGVTAEDDLRRFMGDPAAALHDPARLPDAGVFRDRVLRARDAREPVLVFGDFDADGITGLTILTLALRRLGIDALPYVPSRLDEGHGLSLAAVDAARTAGAGVIVTVDTGSSSVSEVAAANDAGIDVLITDHHRVPSELPRAVAIVNPHRPDAAYPDPRLAGSGVAFTLARLLLGDAALGFADLAAIGTVADLAPVLGENRAIVQLGLEVLRAGPRPGLAALLAAARVNPGDADLEDIAFAVAPRLNAAGRVGEAFDAARLLLSGDPEEAQALAATLEAANGTRKDLMRAAVAEARTSPDAVDDAAAVVVRGPWPVGIVGLVASRLAEERLRPAVVGAELGAIVRASCRSAGGFHLADALASCSDILLRHGGHAGAAGFEIEAEKWPAFRERFIGIAAAAGPPDPVPSLAIDVALRARDVDYALHRDLQRLAPCGAGNPEPLVAVLGLTVTRAREAGGGGHTQLVLKRRLDVLDGIAFGWPELAGEVTEGAQIDVVAQLRSRRFGGIESLQLDIRDAAPSGYHPEARAILEASPVAVGPGPAVGLAPAI